MSEKIKAFIVNRNLLTTLKSTVDFLLKEPRVEVIIFDQESTYPPLLEYYKNCEARVIYNNRNGGPHSTWGLYNEFNKNYFILADSDCDYVDVPDDWLDKMIDVLVNSDSFKVGFSLSLDNLPDNDLSRDVINRESGYWKIKEPYGWVADVDTTFALYRPHSPFSYKAIRLDKPYCIKHVMWHLTAENITDEWRYYLNNVTGISTWGSKLKNTINK
jgi:hypothetical protein